MCYSYSSFPYSHHPHTVWSKATIHVQSLRLGLKVSLTDISNQGITQGVMQSIRQGATQRIKQAFHKELQKALHKAFY